jgi:hypothetical protein
MSVFLLFEKDEADLLLALAGKGMGVYAQRVDAASTVEDIAGLAMIGVIYAKVAAEIAKEEERLRKEAETGHERTDPQ